MNKKNKNWKLKQLLLDLLFFLVLLALDQGTKYLAVTHLKDRSSVKIWPGVFELQYLENRGAAFGILQDGKLFFVFAAIVMLTVIAFILVKTPKGKKYRTWHILLTFIAAGAIGNMIDRLRLDYVVDFFYISLIDFPIFNVADLYVSFCTAILIIFVLFFCKEDDLKFISLQLQKQKKVHDQMILEITENQAGERIDRFLADSQDLTRSFLQKILKEGEVIVNGKSVKANYKLRKGDRIEFEIPEAVEPDIVAEDIPLSILYEDAVDKPKGMVVHPAAGHYSRTLVNAVMYHCKGELSGINGVLRPGIVHRIDRDTTGSIII